MDAESIAAMLREDRAEWEALASTLDAHPEGPLHDPSAPSWTSRDVYAHLARWIGRSTAHLDAYLAGAELPKLEGTDDQINARWQREDSARGIEEARGRAQLAFERRIRAVESVRPDKWDDVLEKIARADGSEHYAAHRSYVVPSV